MFVFLHLYISREMTWSRGEGPVSPKSHHMPTSSLQTEIHYISKETLSEGVRDSSLLLFIIKENPFSLSFSSES